VKASLSVQEGKVVGFFDAFQAGRKFALDMAGTVTVIPKKIN
jgi:hypothetical protein